MGSKLSALVRRLPGAAPSWDAAAKRAQRRWLSGVSPTPLHCGSGGGPEKLVVLMEGEALLNDASGEVVGTEGFSRL